MSYELYQRFNSLDISFNGTKIYENVSPRFAACSPVMISEMGLASDPMTDQFVSFNQGGLPPKSWDDYVAIDKGDFEFSPASIGDQYFNAIGDEILYTNHNLGDYPALGAYVVSKETSAEGTVYGIQFRLYYAPGVAPIKMTEGATLACCGYDHYGRLRHAYFGAMLDVEHNSAGLFYYTDAEYVMNNSASAMSRGGTAANVAIIKNQLYVLLSGFISPTTDPYTEHADPSEPAVPDGSYDDSSDTISMPSVPALNLSLTHFMSAYSPTIQELNDLADWLWGDYSGSDRHIAKFFADPTDAIISLHMLPFTPDTSTPIHVCIGRYDTLEEMSPITSQFKDIDCGSLEILPYWDNYLDCNPYTRYTLVLPFVGEVQLDPDEILRETVNIVYRVDVLSGAFVCFVKTATKILAQYNGNCSLQCPISSANYAAANAAILRIATSAAGIAMGGISGAAALSETAEGALTVSNSKVNHSHSGSIAGTAGFLGTMKPYLLIHRARQCVPARQNQFGGYPLLVTGTLGDFAGWTSVESIILDGIPFTLEEVEAFRQILHDGIII